MPCTRFGWRWPHGQFFEICLINIGGLCLSTRESVRVQDMTSFYLRDTFPEANICGSSTQMLRAGCRPRSRGYRLMASSLSARSSQQSYSEADCDRGGKWPKTRSLHPSRRASASPYPEIIGNAGWVSSRCELLDCTPR